MEYFVISFNKGAACVVIIMAITVNVPKVPVMERLSRLYLFLICLITPFSPKKSMNWRLNLEQLVQLFQFAGHFGLLALSRALVLESNSSLFFFTK